MWVDEKEKGRRLLAIKMHSKARTVVGKDEGEEPRPAMYVTPDLSYAYE